MLKEVGAWDFPGGPLVKSPSAKAGNTGLINLPDPGIEPGSPALAGSFFTTEPPGKPRDVNAHPPNYSWKYFQ